MRAPAATFALAILALLAAPREARAVGDGDGFVVTLFGTWAEKDAIDTVQLAAQAGARHVTFLVFLLQDSPSASNVRWDGEDPATPFARTTLAPRLSRAIAAARRLGLSCGIDPIVRDPQWHPRRSYWPDDRAAWFESYTARMRELGAFAQAEGCDEVIAGSELSYLFQATSGWRGVIAAIRGVFAGHVTVSATFADFATYRFWDACDSIGVSAYFPLAASKSARSTRSFERALRAWRLELALVARIWRKPVTFVEVGYPATDAAAVRPWDYDWPAHAIDEDLQARCFEALSDVFAGDPLVRRMTIWGGQTPAIDREGTGGKGFLPLGKAADPVVRKLFALRRD
jgi:hypothetical protein